MQSTLRPGSTRNILIQPVDNPVRACLKQISHPIHFTFLIPGICSLTRWEFQFEHG